MHASHRGGTIGWTVGVSLLLLGGLLPSAAGHFAESGSVTFDHKTGNEWWVEVVIGGPDAAKVVGVEAQERFDREWHTLTKRSWGAWAASFHIPVGNDVRFRATTSDGSQAVSCWFSHPGGTEKCLGRPAAGWEARPVAVSGDASTDLGLATGDHDGDGKDSLFVPTRSGTFSYTFVAGAWREDTVLPDFGNLDRTKIVAGDLDGDGGVDLFSSGWHFDGSVGRDYVYHHEWNGAGWASHLVLRLPFSVQSMGFGDADGDGDDEVYIGSSDGFGRRTVTTVDRDPAGGYDADVLSAGAGGELAIGDADRDGGDEIWTASYNGDAFSIERVGFSGGSWHTDTVKVLPRGHQVQQMVAADGDNDGQEELYALVDTGTSAYVLRLSHQGGGVWREVTIAIGTDTAYSLLVADPDDDGKKALYVGDIDGGVREIRWTGSAWSARLVAQVGSGDPVFALARGDADGDGDEELFAGGWPRLATCCAEVGLYRVSFTGSPPPFDATFSGVLGNEWWVQAQVQASGEALQRVDVRFDGGAWKPLADKGWGWAASYHIPQDTQVQLRATSVAGSTELSACYRWIPPSGQDAAIVTCGVSAFDASFTGVKGNEWWVQTSVSANRGLAGVDARVDCGSTWVPLVKQSWGGWAKSFHVPSGSKVDFRARATDGATDLSGGYVWPSATPTSGC